MDEERAQYVQIDYHVFRVDSAARFEATQVLIRVHHLSHSEAIRWN